MFGLVIPALLQAKLIDYGRKALIYLAIFVAGYLLCWHRNSVNEAEKAGIQETAHAAITAGSNAIDKTVLESRDTQIKDLHSQNNRLNLLLEKATHENPASADCRLPDGVRSELNRQLGSDQP